jgi:ketosteroid isomerase-like protein
MSQENVEIHRIGFDAANRGDWAAAAATWDPHIVVRSDPSWPEWGCFGREAAIAFLKEGSEAWGPQLVIDEIVDLGDRLLVRCRYSIHAARSGVEGEQPVSEIVTYREGRAILIEFFLEHTHALEAVGLEE